MLLTKDDFQKGQVVACKHAGNKARRNKGYTLGVVKSSGKYVTVGFNEEMKNTVKFILEEKFERDYLLQKSNYAGDYELFPSEQAYLEHEEKNDKLISIQNAVSTTFNNCTLTIDQVRRIYEIINE